MSYGDLFPAQLPGTIEWTAARMGDVSIAKGWTVLVTWGSGDPERYPVTSVGEAWRVSREWLSQGYQVAFSLALADEIKARKAARLP
jgi:hypothetical protein